MIWVVIDDGVAFAPNQGVRVLESVLDWSSEKLQEAVHRAFSHMKDRFLVDACCGGRGPLADRGEVTYEDYLELTRQAELQESLAGARRTPSRSK